MQLTRQNLFFALIASCIINASCNSKFEEADISITLNLSQFDEEQLTQDLEEYSKKNKLFFIQKPKNESETFSEIQKRDIIFSYFIVDSNNNTLAHLNNSSSENSMKILVFSKRFKTLSEAEIFEEEIVDIVERHCQKK